MSLPNETELIDGLLKAMQRLGRPASIEEQETEVIRFLGIRDHDAAELHEGSRTKLNYRLAWARTYLKSVGLLHAIDRGVWELTKKGAHYDSIVDLKREDIEEFQELFEDEGGIEGLDESTPAEFGEYPIDSVLIRQEMRTVYETVRRIRDDLFIMDPDFQRDFIWNLEKQSRLIESMVMRIPLPVFYLAERDDGKKIVVDGLQRLTTFQRFLDDEFALRDLRLASELNAKRFSQLPLKLQNRIEDVQLILYLIDPKVPERAKLDIFDRVNGGVPLTRQQMRNSIYCGEATKWLRAEVQSEEFKAATSRSLDWRSMRDRECVNRFCAFCLLGVSAYSSEDMDSFLAHVLQKMNRSSLESLDSLSSAFRRSMRNNHKIFGPHAFRKHRRDSIRRSVINVALFDVFSVLLSRVDENLVDTLATDMHEVFYDLMDNDEFVDAITISTNSTRKVITRFELAEAKLGALLNVHQTHN